MVVITGGLLLPQSGKFTAHKRGGNIYKPPSAAHYREAPRLSHRESPAAASARAHRPSPRLPQQRSAPPRASAVALTARYSEAYLEHAGKQIAARRERAREAGPPGFNAGEKESIMYGKDGRLLRSGPEPSETSPRLVTPRGSNRSMLVRAPTVKLGNRRSDSRAAGAAHADGAGAGGGAFLTAVHVVQACAELGEAGAALRIQNAERCRKARKDVLTRRQRRVEQQDEQMNATANLVAVIADRARYANL